jgi:hypothetical protein
MSQTAVQRSRAAYGFGIIDTIFLGRISQFRFLIRDRDARFKAAHESARRGGQSRP